MVARPCLVLDLGYKNGCRAPKNYTNLQWPISWKLVIHSSFHLLTSILYYFDTLKGCLK